MEDADIPLFADFLQREHVARFFHDPEDWLHEVKTRHGEYAFIHHFMATVEDSTVGFCQYYDCFDARHLEDWYDVDARGAVYSIDYMVADPACLGKGVGKAIVHALVDTIAVQPGAQRIIAQPEPENLASCGLLRACGFQYDDKTKQFVLPIEKADSAQ